MKKVLLVSLLFVGFYTSAQKSFQFSDPQPVGVSAVSTCDEICFGRYKDAQTGATYVIDETGIGIETTVINFVTREQIRESSKLKMRGNWLFGVKANDSVPCFEEGDKVYYGIPQKLVVVGTGTMNSLKRISPKKYVINFHEGNYFEPSLMVFDEKGLHITHPVLEYTAIYNRYLQIETIVRYGEPVAILAPTNDQWKTLETLLYTEEDIDYSKEK